MLQIVSSSLSVLFIEGALIVLHFGFYGSALVSDQSAIQRLPVRCMPHIIQKLEIFNVEE